MLRDDDVEAGSGKQEQTWSRIVGSECWDGGLESRFAHMDLIAAGLLLSPAAGTASEIASEGSKPLSGFAGEVMVNQPIGE